MTGIAAGPALADPPRATVEKLLSGYEPRSTPADFRRLGEGADRVIVEIATDSAVPQSVRVRALAALAFVPSELGQSHCRSVIRSESGATEGASVLASAACAHTLGAFPQTAATDLTPLLSHPNAEVRLGAVRGLELARAKVSIPNLRRQLQAEPDPGVRTHITRVIDVLSRR